MKGNVIHQWNPDFALIPTCQCEFSEVVAGVGPSCCQQGDGRVRYVFAVSQVKPLQLWHVALQ